MSSTMFSVRLFYCLLAVSLYNLWGWVDLLLTADRTVESGPVLRGVLFWQFYAQPYG
jgi:hypothetical protein